MQVGVWRTLVLMGGSALAGFAGGRSQCSLTSLEVGPCQRVRLWAGRTLSWVEWGAGPASVAGVRTLLILNAHCSHFCRFSRVSRGQRYARVGLGGWGAHKALATACAMRLALSSAISVWENHYHMVVDDQGAPPLLLS